MLTGKSAGSEIVDFVKWQEANGFPSTQPLTGGRRCDSPEQHTTVNTVATMVDGPVQHVKCASPCDIGGLHDAVDLLMKTVTSAQRPSHVNTFCTGPRTSRSITCQSVLAPSSQ